MCNSVISNMTVPTFFEQLVIAKVIPDPSFSFYLGRARDYMIDQSLEGSSNMCLGCMAVPYNQQVVGAM
jgi:hypothetical protein